MITRVKSRRQPIEPKSWAWIVELRENETLKKVYDVNPYAEVYSFKENVYSIYTESANGMGDPWVHLIVGSEKAMVIDTSFGVGNLKGLVDELTGGMPLIVANTHPHLDHSGGNCQFDRVYCHEYSVPDLERRMRSPLAWDQLFDEKGKPIWLDFDKKDLIPYKEYEIVGCPNNYIFDLGGGHEMELIWMPGHAPGVCFFLDKKNRILFTDDTLTSGGVNILVPRPNMAYSEFITVTALRNELAKLVQRNDEFDTLFPQHSMLELDKSLVQSMLDACNEVVNDPNCFDDTYQLYLGSFPQGIEMKIKKLKGVGISRLAYDLSCV